MTSQAKALLGQAIQSAGESLTRKEASKISRSTGKSVAQVMAKAQDKGVALGSGLVNKFNRGLMGPNLGDTRSFFGVTLGQPGVDKGTTRALEKLAPLQNLQMSKGTVYAGYSTTTTPGATRNTPMEGFSSTPARTTYNPIVLPKSLFTANQTAPAQASTTTETTASTPATTTPATSTTATTTQTPSAPTAAEKKPKTIKDKLKAVQAKEKALKFQLKTKRQERKAAAQTGA